MLRPATADDLGALKSVVDETDLFPSQLLEEMMAAYLTDPACGEIWLTDDDGGPIGIAYCAPERLTDGTWNLLLIAVRPSRQGHGRGTAILRHVEHALASRNARVLLVETSGLPSFERTRTFYMRNGYGQEARIRDYYRAGDDKIVFYKTLRPTRQSE